MMQLQGKITFVGGGAMGEAIIGSLIRNGLLSPPQICVSEPLPPRREHLRHTFGVRTETDNGQAVGAGQHRRWRQRDHGDALAVANGVGADGFAGH